MKKYLLWMLAAILCCGLTTFALTSCGGDDDDPQPKTPEEQEEQQGGKQEEPKAESYDVTLTLVIQRATLNAFEYDFKYVDAKGNTKTYDIDQDTEGVSFDSFELPRYNTYANTYFPAKGDAFYQDMKNPLLLRITLKDQPTGKKYSFETVCHIKESFQYTEAFVYSFPTVLVTETPKGGQRALKYGNSFNFQIVDVTNWERFYNATQGKKSTLGTDDLTVGE